MKTPGLPWSATEGPLGTLALWHGWKKGQDMSKATEFPCFSMWIRDLWIHLPALKLAPVSSGQRLLPGLPAVIADRNFALLKNYGVFLDPPRFSPPCISKMHPIHNWRGVSQRPRCPKTAESELRGKDAWNIMEKINRSTYPYPIPMKR